MLTYRVMAEKIGGKRNERKAREEQRRKDATGNKSQEQNQRDEKLPRTHAITLVAWLLNFVGQTRFVLSLSFLIDGMKAQPMSKFPQIFMVWAPVSETS